MTQTDRLTKLVKSHKDIYNCQEFQRLSYEVLGSFSVALKKAGCEDPDEMAQNVHGMMILGYMLGYEQRGKQRKKK
jgi:hypothetical protein